MAGRLGYGLGRRGPAERDGASLRWPQGAAGVEPTAGSGIDESQKESPHSDKQRDPTQTKSGPAGWIRRALPARKCPSLVSDVLLSHGLLRSTIGARGLNFRVRNGTGCTSPAMVADQRGAFGCEGRASARCPGGRTAQRGQTEGRPTATSYVRGRRARPISTARLSASRRLHLLPINQVVYLGPYRREDSSRDWLPA